MSSLSQGLDTIAQQIAEKFGITGLQDYRDSAFNHFSGSLIDAGWAGKSIYALSP